MSRPEYPSQKEIREFMFQQFTDEAFETFCFDYFPNVAGNFSRGMRKNEKLQDLIAYCRRDERLDDLLTNLHRERTRVFPLAWKEFVQVEPAPQTHVRNPRQIFLSHANQDAELAQRLAADFEAEGYEVWIAPDSIAPGEKWAEAIDRGLSTSGMFVLLLTPHAVASRWVKTETNVAIELEHEEKMRFVPVMVKACKVPTLWRAYQRVSWRGGYQVGLKSVLVALNGDKSQAVLTPSPAEEKPRNEPVRSPQEEKPRNKPIRSSQEEKPRNKPIRSSQEEKPRNEPVRSPQEEKPRNEPIRSSQEEKPRIEPVRSPRPDRLKKGDTWINPIDSKEFVQVPAGEFLAGDDKKPMHLDEFWISDTPVTNAEYKLFIDANPDYEVPFHHVSGAQPYCWSKKHRTFPVGKADHPVVLVNWHDAQAYAKWAGVALPTEWQWEKAARGADGRIYPWGDEKPDKQYCNFGHNEGTTTPVGQYSPLGDSLYGCVDMAGNVREWTQSLYQEGTDGRVLRGGSWFYGDDFARASFRDAFSPKLRSRNIGFRLCRVKKFDTWINPIDGKEFVRVPAGEFLAGEDKKPMHLDEFWISKTPVTNAEYKLFIDANPEYEVPFASFILRALGAKKYCWDKETRTYPSGMGEHPVVLVNWHDAQAYTKWAGVVLPTEWQWEKAARGTDGRVYPWGDEKPTKQHCNSNEHEGGTTPVGKYSPLGDSPYGCVDMAGNVWEWTQSLYKDGEDWRVLCGGSWNHLVHRARASSRDRYGPYHRDLNLGFRLSRVVAHLNDH